MKEVPSDARAPLALHMGVFQCSNEQCQRISIGCTLAQRGTYQENLLTKDMAWEPTRVRRPEFPDVPEQIAETAAEAHACLSVGANRGAVALARAVVESTGKAKGAKTRNLNDLIDEMAKRDIIRSLTQETAHAIRVGGNEVAHGDLVDVPMPAEEAEIIVEFMDSLLEEVFQHPEKLKRLKQSQQDRKAPRGN